MSKQPDEKKRKSFFNLPSFFAHSFPFGNRDHVADRKSELSLSLLSEAKRQPEDDDHLQIHLDVLDDKTITTDPLGVQKKLSDIQRKLENARDGQIDRSAVLRAIAWRGMRPLALSFLSAGAFYGSLAIKSYIEAYLAQTTDLDNFEPSLNQTCLDAITSNTTFTSTLYSFLCHDTKSGNYTLQFPVTDPLSVCNDSISKYCDWRSKYEDLKALWAASIIASSICALFPLEAGCDWVRSIREDLTDPLLSDILTWDDLAFLRDCNIRIGNNVRVSNSAVILGVLAEIQHVSLHQLDSDLGAGTEIPGLIWGYARPS